MKPLKFRWLRSLGFEGFDGHHAEFGKWYFEIRKQENRSRDSDDRYRLHVYLNGDRNERLWVFPYGLIDTARRKAQAVLNEPHLYEQGDCVYRERKARRVAPIQRIEGHPNGTATIRFFDGSFEDLAERFVFKKAPRGVRRRAMPCRQLVKRRDLVQALHAKLLGNKGGNRKLASVHSAIPGFGLGKLSQIRAMLQMEGRNPCLAGARTSPLTSVDSFS